jgi:uncharacterized protein YlxW (UPF0749 family)
MSLLVDMMTNTLDEAYADAARRRAGAGAGAPAVPGGGSAESPVGRRLVALVLLVALGVVTGMAAAQVRRRDAAQDAGRAELVSEVRDRTVATDELAQQAAGLQDEVAGLRDAALADDAAGRAAASALGLVELAAGTTAVEGPGLVVTLDDAAQPPDPALDHRGGRPDDGRVLDRDLQDAVNGLWAAGAEAISVDGLRLTALTAIRAAGEAVLVDKVPLQPPYVIEAVGDPGALEPRFVDGAAGRRLATYTSLYGIRLDVRRADDLRLVAAREPDLRRAAPVGGSR